MKLDTHKIEARLQKLQEIQRIAADPELVEMLLEFISEDERKDPMPNVVAAPAVREDPLPPSIDDVDFVDQVLKGFDGQGNGIRPMKR